MKLSEGLSRLLRRNDSEKGLQSPLNIENMESSNWALVEDVFDLAQIALWEWDIREDKIRGTRQLYDIVGTQPGDYGDSLFAMLKALVHPDQLAYVQNALQDTLKTGSVDRFKFRIVRSDGQDRWLMLKAVIQPGGGTAVGIVMDCSRSQAAELMLHRDLDFMQTLLDAMPNPVFHKDPEGVYRFCNLSFAQMLGTDRENIIGKTVYDVSGASLASLYNQKDKELIESGGSQAYESKVQIHTGEERVYRFHKAACNNFLGVPAGLVGVMTDITESAAAVSRSQRLAHLKEAMLEVSHSIIGLSDTKNLLEILLDKAMSAIPSSHAGSVLMIDDAGYLRILVTRGYGDEGAEAFKLKIEETFTYRISGGKFEEPFVVNHIPSLVKDGCLEPLVTAEGRAIGSNLSTPIKVEGEPVALVIVDSYDDEVFTDDDIELMGYLKVQAELALTNLKLYQETLRLSRYDHLTGIYNRGYFDKVLGEVMARTLHHPHRLTLVIMDLDGLKVVNDQHGHREGDFRLQAFADAFKRTLGEGDIMGRYGGDEFVAAFFCKDPEDVARSVENVLAELNSAPEHFCSFSYGTAQYPAEGKTPEELVRVADRKLYEHKKTKYFGRRRADYGDQNQ